MAEPVLLNGVWELGPPTATFRLRPPHGKPIIHEGRHAQTGEPVGILLLRKPWCDSAGVRESFLHGIGRVRGLDHPHIVRVLDVLDGPGLLGAVTEPLLGDNVARLVRHGAVTFSEADVVRVLRETAAALAHAHSRGVVFGNIKPTNVELTPAGTVKLSALPKPPYRFVSFLDAAGYLGVPVYNAPEVIRSEPIDERTDVYGLGLTAYEMIVSSVRVSTTGNLGTDLNTIVSQEWPAPATVVEDVHPLLNKVVVRCLQKDPAKRYARAAEVLKDLERVQGKTSCLISHARLLEIVGTVFPAPLATLAQALERDDHLLAQRDKLLNQAGGLIGYLGFLAAAAGPGPLPEDFGRPSLGHWVGLLRQALRGADSPWPLSEFRAHLPSVADFLKGLDEVVHLRNEVAHAAAPEEGAVLHDWVKRMAAAVRRVYKSVLFLSQYALVAVEDMDYRDGRFLLSLRRLEGSGPPGPPVQAALPEPYTKGRVYFAAGDFARLLPLHPWVVLAKCPLCFQRELFFYVAVRGGEVSYVTPDRGHSWSCPVTADWQKVFADP